MGQTYGLLFDLIKLDLNKRKNTLFYILTCIIYFCNIFKLFFICFIKFFFSFKIFLLL